MNTKLLHRSFAGLAFLISLVIYLMTVQPSVPFWDCGEFTAAAVQQQVPHPPGAPLFLMIGKLFHLFIPFGDEGWRVNLVSVVASAASVLLLYLISVKVLNNLRGKKVETFEDAMAVFGSSFVGAMALTFSDTFWFNAVESEVYALSTLFVAVVVYLMMRWNERADTPGHERYLLLIAYLMGLSTGVHLLSILAVFSIVLLVYFRKYDITIGGLLVAGAIAVVLFFGIYPGIVKMFPALLAGNLPFKNEAKEYILSNNPFFIFLAIALVVAAIYGVWMGMKKNRQVLALACSAFVLIILGYSTYTHILLRANAYTPMNENNPNNLEKLVAYLGREQYGDAPMWPRRYRPEGEDAMFARKYREYGEWNGIEYKQVTRSDGETINVPDYKNSNINVSGELNYLLEYQIDQMYLRYLFWNFVGRASDIQDHQAVLFKASARAQADNAESGYGHLFPIRFWGLPLFLGLIGLIFHFYRDSRMAWVYFIMFLAMGVLAAIYQNQQEPQPRERDYFYVGSFMIFCLWIGMGVYALIDALYKQKIKAAGSMAIVVVCMCLVPLNMALGGWKMHDRSGNYLPFDYAYNILQSVEKDAIVFTNGDNDTFPVWFLQDVEGVRRDVRIVNLSLGNTLWYVDQLKNQEPWGAKKIPLSFPDERLQVENEYDSDALTYEFGEAKEIAIPVDPAIMKQYTNDPALLADSKMRFTFVGSPYGGPREGKQYYAFRIQDQLVLDILRQVRWTRPVYYSMSVGPDAFCGLDDHFRMEGMALRICPVPVSRNRSGSYYSYDVSPEIMDKTLLNILPGDTFHREPHYSMKLRNLNNPSVYYDEVHRRLMFNYRTLYMNYANWLTAKGDKKKAAAVLDSMNAYISPVQFPMPYQLEYQVSDLYDKAGASKQAKEFARAAVAKTERLMAEVSSNPETIQNDQYWYYPFLMGANSYRLLGEYDKAKEALKRLSSLRGGGNDPAVQMQIDQLDIARYEDKGDFKGAIAEAERIAQRYSESKDMYLVGSVPALQQKINELRVKAGLAPMADTAQQDGVNTATPQ